MISILKKIGFCEFLVETVPFDGLVLLSKNVRIRGLGSQKNQSSDFENQYAATNVSPEAWLIAVGNRYSQPEVTPGVPF